MTIEKLFTALAERGAGLLQTPVLAKELPNEHDLWAIMPNKRQYYLGVRSLVLVNANFQRLSRTLRDSELVVANNQKGKPVAKPRSNCGFFTYARAFTQSTGEPLKVRIYRYA